MLEGVTCESSRERDGEMATPPKSTPSAAAPHLTGHSFAQRRDEIYQRLLQTTEQCKRNYTGRKELATETDNCVAELCDALEEAFSYGLRQGTGTAALSAASLFQNMHEIVTGNVGGNSSARGSASNNDITFWDFCQQHLTAHERQRYDNLKHIWTKCGRGKAFLRTALNENSLQRYVLTWLAVDDLLHRYYTPWSLLLDNAVARELPVIVGGLGGILFALNVDRTELNVASRSAVAAVREEPIIYAPAPVPVATATKVNIIERPIATAAPISEDLLKAVQGLQVQPPAAPSQLTAFDSAVEEHIAIAHEASFDPEKLEFLKRPFAADDKEQELEAASAAVEVAEVVAGDDDEDKTSDSSSQYSKSSATNSSQVALEQSLRETQERCALLETRVAQLTRDNRLLVRRLTQQFNESGIDPTSSLTTNFLLNIPYAKLVKSHYVYEVHVTMRRSADLLMESWCVQRRYSEFDKLHQSLLRSHPSIVGRIELPPKKHFGNMSAVFVEERRQQLQIYLLNLVEALPQVEAARSKAQLQKVFPFLRDR